MLIKGANCYTLANYQKTESSIFLGSYIFQGVYTKILTIFGSSHNLSQKFKYKTKTAKKEKGKDIAAGGRDSARRPARFSSARADAARAASSPRGH